MPFTPNTVPTYAQGPLGLTPAVLPSTAKTTFTDNANAVLVASNAANSGRKPTFQKLFIQPTANLTAGRMMAFLYNGTTAFLVKDVSHGSITVSTTAEGAEIDFGYTDSDPLYLEEGWSLYIGSAVAQAAGAAIIHGRGKTF